MLAIILLQLHCRHSYLFRPRRSLGLPCPFFGIHGLHGHEPLRLHEPSPAARDGSCAGDGVGRVSRSTTLTSHHVVGYRWGAIDAVPFYKSREHPRSATQLFSRISIQISIPYVLWDSLRRLILRSRLSINALYLPAEYVMGPSQQMRPPKRHHSSTCAPRTVPASSRGDQAKGCSRCSAAPEPLERSKSWYPGRATTGTGGLLTPSVSSASSQHAPDTFNENDWMDMSTDMDLDFAPSATFNNSNEAFDWDQWIASLDTFPAQPVQQKQTKGFQCPSPAKWFSRPNVLEFFHGHY